MFNLLPLLIFMSSIFSSDYQGMVSSQDAIIFNVESEYSSQLPRPAPGPTGENDDEKSAEDIKGIINTIKLAGALIGGLLVLYFITSLWWTYTYNLIDREILLKLTHKLCNFISSQNFQKSNFIFRVSSP